VTKTPPKQRPHLVLWLILVGTIAYVSCVGRNNTSDTITESRAIQLAKTEFARNRRKVDDYSVSIKSDSTGRKWIIWFVRKGKYLPVGGKHFVTVEKAGGKAVFMPGE
jgi:hypothetical protein